MTPDEAHALLTSPLGGLDSMGVRRLGRSLRQVERAELAGNGLPRLSGELVAAASEIRSCWRTARPHKIKWQPGTLRRNYDGARN